MIRRDGPLKIIVILILTVFLLPACHRDTDQDKIKKVIKKVQNAAEEKSILSFLSHVSQAYRDTQGNTYGDIKNLVLVYFYQYPKVSVFIDDPDITLEGASGTAKFQAVLTGRGAGGAVPAVLPESIGIYNFDVQFAVEEGDWKIVSAKWERLSDTPGSKSP